jgi:iron complex transport system substrate-binding protein
LHANSNDAGSTETTVTKNGGIITKVGRNLLIAVLVIVVVIGASWAVWPRASGTEENNKTTTTLTDLAGRNVTLELPVESVVLGDTDSINAFAAVAGEDFLSYIVGGLGDFEGNYPDLYQAYCDAYPEIAEVPPIGGLYDPSTEAIINLQPDVLILPLWSVYQETTPDLDTLEEAGIPTVFIDFTMDPYGDGQIRSLSLLGKLLGQEERADNIIEFYDQEIDAVLDRVAAMSGEKPTVYLEIGMYGPDDWGATSVSMGVSSIDYAGGENIAKGVLTSTGKLDREYILSEDPDVIVICLSPYFGASADGDKMGFGSSTTPDQLAEMAGQYLEREGWSELTAVKEKRVYFYYSGLTFSIDNFAIMQFMASWLYPDDFTDLDPIASLQEFYGLYMPIELEGTWYYSIADMD